ncbi:MAG: hypothetical protein WCD07_11890 [Burkholderiales bacterium]
MPHRILLFLACLIALAACATARDQLPAIPAPELKVGDSWVYEQRNGYNGELLQTLNVNVLDVSGDAIALRVRPSAGVGEFTQILNRELNPRRNAVVLGFQRDFEPAYDAYKFPLNVGQTWRTQGISVDPITKKLLTFKIWGDVVCAEKIRVPAGEFDTLKIVRRVYPNDEEWWRDGTRILETEWYAPTVKRIVRREEDSYYVDTASGQPPLVRRGDWIVTNLTAYKLEK